MGFWGSLASAFGLAKTAYPEYETPPLYMQSSPETLFSSKPEYPDYETPLEYMQGESSKSGFLGSLWDGFLSVGATAKKTVTDVYREAKEVAPMATDLYKQIHEITHPLDNTSLFAKEPSRGVPSSPDQTLYTPYPRESTGAQPAVITTGNGKGLPMSLILIAGAAALILFTKKRR